MSAQAYLDTIERKTGLIPRELVQRAFEQGFTDKTKAGEIATWFKTEFDLGHGHAMTLAQVVRNLDTVDIRNVDITPEPTGSMGRLWLDGFATRPF